MNNLGKQMDCIKRIRQMVEEICCLIFLSKKSLKSNCRKHVVSSLAAHVIFFSRLDSEIQPKQNGILGWSSVTQFKAKKRVLLLPPFLVKKHAFSDLDIFFTSVKKIKVSIQVNSERAGITVNRLDSNRKQGRKPYAIGTVL
jgi:hypothetical protein